MVDGITSSLFRVLPAPQGEDATTFPGNGGGFNAAMEAANKAAARQEAHDQEMAAIKEKGFRDWVRDTQIEKLKEELRQRVMAEMGLDDEALARMTPLMRSILEQKIQEQIEAQLEAEFAKEQQQTGTTATEEDSEAAEPAATASSQEERERQNQPDGKDCPVIPALSWPGTIIAL